MEGQIEPAYCAKRPFIILPLLLTLFTTTTTLPVNASNENPITPNELTFSAVPIIANTVATYRNLKTIQASHTDESATPSINTFIETFEKVSTEAVTAKKAVETPAAAKEEKLSWRSGW